MGCTFCATGYNGFFDNISSDDMLQQIVLIRYHIISNGIERESAPFIIALMGMGEPLLNYEQVIEFCCQATKMFLQHNMIKINISTIGIPERIIALTTSLSKSKIGLYVSIHSPYDQERHMIMPATKEFLLKDILNASKFFSQKMSMLVRASYLLLKDINDSDQHARDFASLLDPDCFEAKVLLYNPSPNMPYGRVSDNIAYRFSNILVDEGIKAIVQPSKGCDISGGCGQFLAIQK